MKPREGMQTYKYMVDRNDTVVRLSENWQAFADDNRGGPRCLPGNVIGSSLWGHICDWETKHLYEIVLERVREHHHRATFPFRCDSPDMRRFLTLSVTPLDEGSINFESKIIKTEARKPVALLDPQVKRSNEFLRICSMCKKIAVSGVEWVEAEVAVERLKLFQMAIMPQFTHGICPSCFSAAMEELDRRKAKS
jgi:hypothetical protein